MNNYNMNDFRTLEQTTFLMLSDDYKERFKAEYYQLNVRTIKLGDFIAKYEAGVLNFKPSCSIGLLRRQYAIMNVYLRILRERAKIEEVKL